MKKVLFSALLIAGTTFAFAKDNVQSTNTLKVDKTLSLEKVIPSIEKEVVSVQNICHKTVFTTQTSTVQEQGFDGTIYTYEQTTTTFYTYWYGC